MIHLTRRPDTYKAKIPWDFAKNQSMIIMPIGDVHFGSEGFPTQHLKDNLRWALDRGCTFLGMGEYLDLTSHSQRAQLGVLRDSTRKELDDMVREKANQLLDILAPTIGRWVGLLEGDHRWDFIDAKSVDQYLCGVLKCPFLGTSAGVRLSAGVKGHPEADAILYAHHGVGSSRTAGGQLLPVENLLKTIDADIYLMGHSHGKVGTALDRQHVSPDKVHYHRTKILARTGAWLKGYASHEPLSLNHPASDSRGSYVEQKAYTPSSLGGICVSVGYEQIHGSRYFKPALHLSL